MKRALPPGLVSIFLGLTAIHLLLAATNAQSQEAAETLSVVIGGLEDEKLKNNVQAYLAINEQAGTTIPSRSRLRWLHNRAEEDIRNALKPFGYYNPTIDSELEQTSDGWLATYRIDPGPPLPIEKLDFRIEGEGSDDPTFQRVRETLPIAEGQTLEHPRYEEVKQDLQNLAAERGYFDARFKENQIRINLEEYTARIVLHFDTGKRYHFGQIHFHQDALAPEFLRRYLDIESGDPYEVAQLLELQTALINSDYFSQVEVGASPDKAVDQTIPVDIYLEPRKATKYTFGLGYGTDTGARGKVSVERRRINRRGHHAKAELIASQIKFGLAGEYVIPGKDPRTDSFALRANITDEDADTKDATTTTVGISRQRQDGQWFKITSLNYLRETFTFSGEENTSQLLTPELNWTRVDADDRLYTTEGNRLGLQLRGAYEGLLSDVSFIQGTARMKWIQSFGDRNRLLLRGDAGTTGIADGDFDDLPASFRFYAGGDRSIRGYSLDSIGPRNDEGDVIGGKHLLIGSMEYERRVRENWSLAAFVDSGDAFNDSPELKTGVGIGLRWLSPVGPVRLDLASGLDEPGDAIRLHFNIGPDL